MVDKTRIDQDIIFNSFQLNESFGRLFDESTMQRLEMKPSKLNKIHTVNKRLLLFLIKFSNPYFINQINEERATGEADDQSSKVIKVPLWSKLLFLICAFTFARLLYVVYWQYIYDFHSVQLTKFKSNYGDEMGVKGSPSDYNQTLARFERRLQEARQDLKSAGAPYIDAPNYVVEPCYLSLLSMVLCTYIIPIIYFRLNKFDISSIRLILDRGYDINICNKEIRTQINNYIESSRMFVLACIKQISVDKHSDQRIEFEPLNSEADLRKVVVDHQLSVCMLKLMALNGSLGPLNKEGEWCDKMERLFFNATVTNIIYSFLFDIFLAWLLPWLGGLRIGTDPITLLAVVQLVTLIEITVLPTVLYVALYVVSYLDLNRFLSEVHKIIRESIDQNDERFMRTTEKMRLLATNNRLLKPSNPFVNEWKVDTCYVQMNSNLLRSIIFYRVVAAKYSNIQNNFSFAVVTAASLIVLLPLIVRAHITYAIPDVNQRIFLLLAFYFGLVCVVFFNLICVPICHMHCRAKTLTNLLKNLLAHAIEHNRLWDKGNVYGRHSIAVLRKELNNTERSTNMFATRVFGLTFDYSRLLKLYFWWGVINLSSASISNSSYKHPLFGQVFSDPLKIYSSLEI